MAKVSRKVVAAEVVEPPLFEVEVRNGVNYVRVEQPKSGSKAFLIESKGIYVFEKGEGVVRSLACTYVGSGAFHVYDGVPPEDTVVGEKKSPLDTRFPHVDGRKIFTMAPQVLGFWGLDAGFKKGLTVVASGGTSSSSPVLVTVMWMKHKEAAEPVIEFAEE